MTGRLLLDWAIMAVSLFNAVLLIWLGLTVLLNAEQRVWGIWLASGGLLMGGAFFISHTAILGLGLLNFNWSMVFWWTVGLVPAIVLPFAWYVVMLWYAGFWGNKQSHLYRRQRPWFRLAVVLLLAGLAGLVAGGILLIVPNAHFTQLRLFIRWSIAGIPLLALGYSVYVVMCIVLALDALRRPGPSRRMMGPLARRRAHPWLAGASVAMLVVSLLVAGVVLWVVEDARQRPFFDIYAESAVTIARFDLLIATIIATAILLLGQAIVSYEVFTGKTLPRRGLLRHWRRTVILAAGYGILVGGSLAVALRPLYSLLLTTMLMTFFYALVSWRSYGERERYIEHLRPFVSSQRLYDSLLTHSAAAATAVPAAVDILAPFQALCGNILGADVAYLAPLGPLAPLVGPPLVYPNHNQARLPPLADVAAQFDSPKTMLVPLNPAHYGGATWAIPLWSERGLTGVFLLGKKRDNGLYTQEEIEIARVSGERLIDTQASAEMARRLMSLQREQLAQSQVIDRRTRRVLHDEILPDLQTTLITLSHAQPNGHVSEAITTLTGAHRQISDLLHEMPTTAAPEVTRLGLVEALKRAIDDELGHAFDEVRWQMDPQAREQVARIPSLTAEVLFYAAREAVRNAARHGRNLAAERPFSLVVSVAWQDVAGLQITIEDNGVGLEASTEKKDPQAGAGQGLALHSTMMAVVGGQLAVDSVTGQYTRIILTLPKGNW